MLTRPSPAFSKTSPIGILVVDSNSILNRAYYGVRPLTTKDGLYTNGNRQ